jgi:hypothetical protein
LKNISQTILGGDRLDFEQYTKEDFYTPAPYEALLAIKDPFQRELEINQLAEYAKTVGVTGFKKLLKTFYESQKLANDTVYIDNTTTFTGQPMELDVGDWRADDFGITRRTGFGEEVACPHPIMPVERLVNIDTGIEKLKIAFSKGKKWRELIVDKRTLASANSIVSLADMGVAVTSENAKALVRYLSEVENINYERIPERKSVGRLGYIEDEGFSPYVDGLIFDGDANFRTMFSAISARGKASDWVSVAKECRAMSTTARIMLAASFASVLVQPFGALPFFVHLWGGESGTGKTVALMLAASVWGDPTVGRYIQTFNSTMVGQEKTAAFLNSLPMLIDELQLAKDHRGRLQFNVYALAQGVGRTRGTKTGGIEKTPTWGNCILTTGESPLTVGGDGEGALNRVIDIECRASETVITDGMRVSGTLKKSYGHAGKLFVNNLTKAGIMDKAKGWFETIFKELSNSDTTEKQAIPAALIIVADRLATEWFFHDGEPLSIEHISEFLRTKASVSMGERGYRYICDWIAQNSARLKPVDNGETYGTVDEEDGYAYIISKVFREACEAGGFSATALLSYLKSNGLIRTRGNRNTIGKRIGNVNTECIAMRLPTLDDDENRGDFIEI